jgi:hypothetical protein
VTQYLLETVFLFGAFIIGMLVGACISIARRSPSHSEPWSSDTDLGV